MVYTRAEAVADGVSDSELKSLLKRGEHVPPRQGCVRGRG